MANIVEFRLPSSRPERRQREMTSPAEIVLFPGVRYERWSEHNAAAGKRRKRDTLELAD